MLARYPAGSAEYQGHLVTGSPSRVMPTFVRRRRVDLVVMGTVARTGLPGFLIGNAAENVLSQLSCSVLAVEPEGFVSPVAAA